MITKEVIDEFFSKEDMNFYIDEDGLNVDLMIEQYNEYSDDTPIESNEEMSILREWIEENGWD